MENSLRVKNDIFYIITEIDNKILLRFLHIWRKSILFSCGLSQVREVHSNPILPIYVSYSSSYISPALTSRGFTQMGVVTVGRSPHFFSEGDFFSGSFDIPLFLPKWPKCYSGPMTNSPGVYEIFLGQTHT